MAYGTGTWLTQNKVLPGTYINFASLKKATSAISDRGIAAAPFILNFGPENTVFEVTIEEFQKNSKAIFGYDRNAPEMLALREIFCHATKVYCYRLGSGTAASNTFGTAKYSGTRGNDISISISKNVDDSTLYDISTYISGAFLEKQSVKSASELIDNDFVIFKKDATLEETSGTPMTGGANCSEITGEHHKAFLDAIESYSYNALCCPASDDTVVSLYTEFNKRMRDTLGAKAQLVAFEPKADYEGVIGVWNEATHPSITTVDKQALVYWVTGAQAGVSVNKSLTNTEYDGELTVKTGYTQSELEDAIKAGKFMFHNANGTVRVLEDINTLVTLTDEKGEVFKSNQTVRVCDQIANDVAVLFNTRYVGTVPNDESGRASLWNDVVKIFRELEHISAIENFDSDTVTIDMGEKKKSVLLNINGVNVINAMSQLYMSVIIQ